MSFESSKEPYAARTRERGPRVLGRARHVPAERRTNAPDAPRFVFFEGPPTANGHPGTHHVLARTVKDIVCRYKTMRGFLVERKAGWDTHGLPVEIEVEKQLDLESKEDIERYGVAEFTDEVSRQRLHVQGRVGRADAPDGLLGRPVRPVRHVHQRLRRVGLAHPQAMWDRDLIYKGHKILPVLPALRHAALEPRGRAGLRDAEDPSVFVRMRLKDGPGHVVPRLDDDAVDAHLERRAGRRSRRDLRQGAHRRRERSSWPRRSFRCSTEEYEVVEKLHGDRPRRARSTSRSTRSFQVDKKAWYVIAGGLRHARGRHGHRPHGARLRRGRLPRRASSTTCRSSSRSTTRGSFTPEVTPWAGHVHQGRGPAHHSRI